ncbi:hypothetical protein ABE504_24235 [Paenibacillus oryzisoli]|uniref:hypothetical protein n=1 Tax=Paenibacillus oryzisoli TaxID=1850517 RepID=UPI003D2A96D2
MNHNDLLSRLSIRKSPAPLRYLKWHNDIIATIEDDGHVSFSDPTFNITVAYTTGGKREWTPAEFREFLSERLPSRSRRDIEKILRRCSLTEYDEFSLANVTRALNARDLLWLSTEPSEPFDEIVSEVFSQIFVKKLDLQGDSLLSPEGVNEKRYGVSRGSYGIFKKRLHPYSSDVESEVAVYELGKLLGVDCCPSWLVENSRDTVAFSKFEYNFAEEFIVHLRRLFSGVAVGDNEYRNLLEIVPEFKVQIQKMILLDFITRQTDRHMSNVALKVDKNGVDFYKLYDNGCSLFYEDKEELINKALQDIPLNSTEFGLTGTYYDYVLEISRNTDVSTLIDLSISKDQIYATLRDSRLTGSRLEGSVEWVHGCLQLLKSLK